LVQTEKERKAKSKEYYQKNKEKYRGKTIEEENRKKGIICKREGCTKGVRTKDLCDSHYHVTLRKIKSESNKIKKIICKWEGCTKGVNYTTKGLCHDHYTQTRLKEFREMIFQNLNQRKCQKCGIDDLRVLNFDHIYDDGKYDHPNKGNHWWKKYAEDPELTRKKLQVLCYNCNFIKEIERKKIKFLEN